MKNTFKLSVIFIFIIAFAMCDQKKDNTEPDISQPPAWAKDAIWYQIFVERFNNGDPANNPTPEDMYAATNYRHTPENWHVTQWHHNWYAQEAWTEGLETDFYGGLGLRRFGGDLQGVLDKLDYLEELGITAVYFNPLNDAPSLHKYDARNYHHIDVNFGPDPEGDKKIMASENPEDPTTWRWTAADKMFLRVVDEFHKRGIRVILDYSWNHTGVEFWAWKDIVDKQQKSKYRDWYAIQSFDDPKTEENEFEYEGWLDLRSLPEIKKVDLATERRIGYPYEGDINKGAKKHIFDVTERWLAPDGDVSKGIDGFRLDVADHIGMIFWRDWRRHVRSINPEAYLVGEIWWEEYPDALMNPVPYLRGDVFDAVMFYQVFRPARYFFTESDFEIDAAQFRDSLQYQWNRLRPETVKAMMNTAATHDSPRLLTSFANKNTYKYQAKPNDNPGYITGLPDDETYQRVRLYLIHQFTIPGAPHIWNGDEMGMTGGDDPDCRKPLWWPEFEFEPEYRNNFQEGEKVYDTIGFNWDHFEFYKQLIRLRKENPVLVDGDIEFQVAKGKLLSYKRMNDKDEIIVMFNLEEGKREFPLASGNRYVNLLDGREVSGAVSLLPLTSAVCRRLN
ncbi:MAG: alpha-amylase family glycosyl hydrolase [bacterium]